MLIFTCLVGLFLVAVLVGLLIAYGIDPLPYRDPEAPPGTT